MLMKRKGFSLVEVVISIALIVILIGMTYSAITISMTQTNTNELERLALHEIENLRDVFRNKGEYLDEAVNLYLTQTAVTELNGSFFTNYTLSSTSSSFSGPFVTALILYYDKSGGLVGFLTIADSYRSSSGESGTETPNYSIPSTTYEATVPESPPVGSSVGQTEDEAFTVTITVGADRNFADEDADFYFKAEITGGKTVYDDSVLTEEEQTTLKGLANNEITALQNICSNNSNTDQGIALEKALNEHFKKTSSAEKIFISYGIVETIDSSSMKLFYVNKLTLYYDDSGELLGFTTLAERRPYYADPPLRGGNRQADTRHNHGLGLCHYDYRRRGQIFYRHECKVLFQSRTRGRLDRS